VNAIGTALWLYAGSHPDLMTESISTTTVRFVARLHSAPILVYAIGAVMALWYVPASLVLFVAVPAFFILPNRFLDRRLAVLAHRRQRGESGEPSSS
jgi:hypothetical protein